MHCFKVKIESQFIWILGYLIRILKSFVDREVAVNEISSSLKPQATACSISSGEHASIPQTLWDAIQDKIGVNLLDFIAKNTCVRLLMPCFANTSFMRERFFSILLRE